MKFVPDKISRAVVRKALETKKQSPHIFFALGVAGVIGGTVLACKATLKVEPILKDIQEDVNDVKGMGANIGKEGISYTDKEYYHDLGRVYGRGAGRIVKLYGPSILVGTASIAALTGSHVQLTRRNSALTFTLAAVSKAYDDYRVRIQEEIGVERELDIYRDVQDAEGVDENGKKVTAKVVNPNAYSVYARIFDEANPNFEKTTEFNRMFIQHQENYANHKLQSRGHLFLNEVYDSLGMERSQEGSVVGWLYNGDGDNYVDFKMCVSQNVDFINGFEPRIWLDFNVDGIIYDKI